MGYNSYSEDNQLAKNLSIIKERLNRRQGDRLLAELDFSYKIQGKKGVFYGKCLNISSYGIGFAADTTLFEDEKILFNFKLNGENFIIPGKVVFTQGKETSAEFDISDDERQRFISLFNKEIKHPESSIRLSIRDIKKRLD